MSNQYYLDEILSFNAFISNGCETIEGNLYISSNLLESLEGLQNLQIVNGDLHITGNDLENLEGLNNIFVRLIKE